MQKETEILLEAVRQAGATIQQMQNDGFAVERKQNNDLLTAADLRANEILKSFLLDSFPQYGWLSEESVDDPVRLQAQRVWIVDPIDGTIEYAKGIPEYAISVALVEQGEPILAAVYNPATGELFHAVKSQGAWLNNQPIRCDSAASKKSFVLLASRSEDKRGEWEQFKQQHDVRIVGSIAYKLALVAAGKADATFSLGPKSEWDIAAGVMLVQESGGVALDKQAKKFQFNQKNILVSGIVACAGDIKSQVFTMTGGNLMIT